MKKIKSYMDTLLENPEFKEAFAREYQKVCIGEQIACLRQQANLTQARLAELVHTTKSAISRYESARYDKYSVPLLNRIARACGAELHISFTPRHSGARHVSSGAAGGTRRRARVNRQAAAGA